MATVTVYTRAQCGLCRKAEEVVDTCARGRAQVELIDIDRDAQLQATYHLRVPVVAVDGREIAQYHLDARVLDAALRQAGA